MSNSVLKHIATIQTGVFAKPVAKGEIVYLQSKHFDKDGTLTSILYPDLKADEISEKHLLIQGDVLFAAKGAKNFATWFEDNNKPAVASTSFFVIRLQVSDVIPAYLTWFLNHPNTQLILKGYARGTAMASISKSVLEELEIPIPSIDQQKIIVKLAELSLKEYDLRTKIQDHRKQIIQQQIINTINK